MNTNLRSRRSEAQLHALAEVEREIRLTDHSNRRKYLREFNQAFRSYQSILTADQIKTQTSTADILLVGDYHALPECQRFAAKLLEERAQPSDRPVILAVETVFSRDQHILDEWWRRQIDEAELRQRIRFDLDWGYDWAPFYQLLVTARDHAEAIYGLDCMPREDLRKIGARDRHAAHKLAEIRQRHPEAVVLVLFGESHLAPRHLPEALRAQLPDQKILTILQNVDALYWQAAGEAEPVDAVQVSDDVVCVFNSTPLEKYENYRLHLSRWVRGDEGPDVAPTIYNLIDSLLRFLGFKMYSAQSNKQPKFLVDLLPEIFSDLSDARLQTLLVQETTLESEQAVFHKKIENEGCVYLPHINAFYVREFQMMSAAEEAARCLHRACRGLPQTNAKNAADLFFTRVIECALGYFGSRVLYPARPAAEDGAGLSAAALTESLKRNDAKSAQKLGYAIGSNLYDEYLAGVLSRARLRNLFLARLDEPGIAQKLCADLVSGRRLGRKGPYPERAMRARNSRSRSA